MRYLKTYKIFEGVNQDEILDDIKDILLELEDAGYFILVNWTPLTLTGYSKQKEIFIQINKVNKPQFVKDETELEALSSSLDRLKTYLMSSNYEIKNFFFDNSSYNLLTHKIESGKSFRWIFDEFWVNRLTTYKEFGDIGDYIQLTLREK